MEKQVFLRYPYTLGTFVETARRDGLAHAFKEDWAMTKRDIGENIWQGVMYSAFATALVVAPIVLCAYAIKERRSGAKRISRLSSLESL